MEDKNATKHANFQLEFKVNSEKIHRTLSKAVKFTAFLKDGSL